MTRTQSGPPVAWIWAGVALLAVLLASVLFWVITLSMRDTDLPSSARTVPNLVDVAADRAQDDLEDLDLKTKLVLEPSATITEGNVTRTSPVAGTSVNKGEQITLYVSSGKQTVVVPLLEGLSRSAAEAALTKAGLKLGTVIQRNDKGLAADVVMEASEAEGAEVAPDSVIDLVVASGKITLRDLTGFTLDAATAELTDLGLSVNPIEQADCAATDPATVRSMSVAPGDVPVGSTVDLRYCTGE